MTAVLAIAIAILSLLLLALVSAIVLVLRDAATKEAAAVLPECTRNVIERARDRLPEDARARFEEEWPAGFEDAIERRPAWALMQAISLYRGAGQIARVLEPATAPTSGRDRPWTAKVPGGGGIVRWADLLRKMSLRRLLARLEAIRARRTPSISAGRFLFILLLLSYEIWGTLVLPAAKSLILTVGLIALALVTVIETWLKNRR